MLQSKQNFQKYEQQSTTASIDNVPAYSKGKLFRCDIYMYFVLTHIFAPFFGTREITLPPTYKIKTDAHKIIGQVRF